MLECRRILSYILWRYKFIVGWQEWPGLDVVRQRWAGRFAGEGPPCARPARLSERGHVPASRRRRVQHTRLTIASHALGKIWIQQDHCLETTLVRDIRLVDLDMSAPEGSFVTLSVNSLRQTREQLKRFYFTSA